MLLLLLLPYTILCCTLTPWGLPVHHTPGDRIFNIPTVLPMTYNCGDAQLDKWTIQLFEAVLYTIQYVNTNLLNGTGFCLDTAVLDNCFEPSETVEKALRYIGRLSEVPQHTECNATDEIISENSPVVGFLGPVMSSNAMALANLCNVLKMPQISSTATSSDLGDDQRYPYFLRTVLSDQQQAKAIVEIIKEQHHWKYAGILASDDSYGGAGLSAFLSEASKSKLCISFQYRFGEGSYEKIVNYTMSMLKETKLNVIVLFANNVFVPKFFEHQEWYFGNLTTEERGVMRERVKDLVYIGTDSWSTDYKVFKVYYKNYLRSFIGVALVKRSINGFDKHLQSLNRTNYNSIYHKLSENYFLDYYVNSTNDSLETFQKVMLDIDQHTTTTSDAILAFGEALKIYIQENSTFNNTFNTNTQKLFTILKSLNFKSLTNSNVSFDDKGGNYNIVHYNSTSKTFPSVGNYSSSDGLNYPHNWIVESICKEKCKGGFKRRNTKQCCWECDPCPEHSISDPERETECKECPTTFTNNTDSTDCVSVPPQIIQFHNLYAFILYGLITAGIIGISSVATVFFVKFETPVAQGHGVFIYMTLLSACLLLLGSAVLFIGKPSDLTCNLQFAIPGVTITSIFLCIICLTKTVILKLTRIQTLFNLDIQFYVIQLVILVVGLTIPCVTIAVILYIKPFVYHPVEIQRGLHYITVYAECKMRDKPLYIEYVIYSYFLFISTSSLILSFIGRNINENFNEGKFLAAQSIAMHIVMVAILPTLAVLSGHIRSGVAAMGCVLLTYVVLIVLFVPKIYIIIYRPYKNVFIEAAPLVPRISNGSGVVKPEDVRSLVRTPVSQTGVMVEIREETSEGRNNK